MPAPRARPPRRISHRHQAGTRRGHGLGIVADVAAAHGGRFAACAHERGASAVLELPLAARCRAPVSRRARAVGFASAAALCAGLAAGATGGVAGRRSEPYGELREVVVAAEPLAAGRPLGRTAVGEALEIRRVPESFVPPDALASPAQALGRRPATTIPAGGYLLASQFEAPRERRGEARDPARRRATPVEIAVEGAGALAPAGRRRRRVDVIVTTEASPGAEPGAHSSPPRRSACSTCARSAASRRTRAAGRRRPRPGSRPWRSPAARRCA